MAIFNHFYAITYKNCTENIQGSFVTLIEFGGTFKIFGNAPALVLPYIWYMQLYFEIILLGICMFSRIVFSKKCVT